ncbi:MAG: stage II sporulation protein M [Pirellulaceae bacterium]|nr:stage II sporulation protein M [Pirellulaceae bacterium]
MSYLAETINKRRADWDRLEQLLGEVAGMGVSKRTGAVVVELSELYRRACADLAMAEQYQLSPSMIDYLHALVGRAHNTLYGSRRFQYRRWMELAFHYAPREIYRDSCIQIVGLLFFGLFSLSAFLGYNEDRFPMYAEKVLGADQIQDLEQWHERDFGRDVGQDMAMAAFYIQHNTGIGFQCFAWGPLILPGLFVTVFNAVSLGACFGYMARGGVDGGDNFLEFVTAHGAFELTAIALSAGVGLRIGIRGWLFTGGLTRTASLQLEGRRSIPIISVAAVLFFLAALTEGFISPSTLPYGFKALWLILSSSLLMFYFVVLGYPEPNVATGQD